MATVGLPRVGAWRGGWHVASQGGARLAGCDHGWAEHGNMRPWLGERLDTDSGALLCREEEAKKATKKKNEPFFV